MVKGQYWVIEMTDSFAGTFAYSFRSLEAARSMANKRKKMHPTKTYLVMKDAGLS